MSPPTLDDPTAFSISDDDTFSNPDINDIENEENIRHGMESRTRRFPGEDLTPTTDRELKGWYFAGLAAEVYAVCGVGEFLFPIT
jgi:UMF1 family MFS transporter